MWRICFQDFVLVNSAMFSFFFDVIVVGGGHAGVEACCAAAKTGVNTLLITDNTDNIGKMSCNPAIGGVGKGQLVKEIDAFGGIMGAAADFSGVFFKKLNSSKGYAAHSTRVQVDPFFYRTTVINMLCGISGIRLLEGTVSAILCKNDSVNGVVLLCGTRIYASSVIVATGTFLNGVSRVGNFDFPCGRIGDVTTGLLFKDLRRLFTNVCRFRTGTPPRVCRKTLNTRFLQKQKGDKPIPFFTLSTFKPLLKQKACYLTETNKKTHEIVHDALYKTAAYKGKSVAFGPRYCLSIEDKILRFSKELHQIFLECDGVNLDDIYLNGLSTSAPLSVQYKMLRSIRGLCNVKINFPGYMVEYDCFDPKDLSCTLETKIFGLFFAGQINGTTGYEEAAAQGLVCGMNAARAITCEPKFIPSKNNTFLGVLIEDLTKNGVTEPYRMFTSRVDKHVDFREDNVYTRVLTDYKMIDVFSTNRWFIFKKIQAVLVFCWKSIEPGSVKNLAVKKSDFKIIILTKTYSICSLKKIGWFCFFFTTEVSLLLSIYLQYAGRSVKNNDAHTRKHMSYYLNFVLDFSFNYYCVEGLSFEAKEKLNIAKPYNVKQASCLTGITVLDINFLIRHIRTT